MSTRFALSGARDGGDPPVGVSQPFHLEGGSLSHLPTAVCRRRRAAEFPSLKTRIHQAVSPQLRDFIRESCLSRSVVGSVATGQAARPRAWTRAECPGGVLQLGGRAFELD
jgi:hypothetical protein